MSSLDRHCNTKTHWRSLAELADAPQFRAFLEAEFPASADPGGISRRRWLQLMGASLALAGVGGCRWEKEEILPFVHRAANRVPGKPQRYATAMDLAGSAIGLLVTSMDGRPVKIEGNPKHPASLGATDSFAQAAILELYDPDRSQSVYERVEEKETARTWDDFDEFARSHFGALRNNGGNGFRVLAEASSSPTRASMQARLLETLPHARWYEYEPISRDNGRSGNKAAFGETVRTHLDLAKARVVLCLDADPLGSHPAAVRYARDFASGRDVADGKMNRLYAAESRFSITGAAADHRVPIRCADVAALTAVLEETLAEMAAHPEAWAAAKATRQLKTFLTTIGAAGDLVDPLGPMLGVAARAFGVDDARDLATRPNVLVRLMFLYAAAEDLLANRGQSLVVAGRTQPPEVHAAAARINAALDNVGKTVSYLPVSDPQRPTHLEAIRSLVAEMQASQVDTLLVLGGNPVYNAPADLDFAEAFQKVGTRIHLSTYRNETSRASTWHLPQAHFLESWGDARSYDGTYSVVQPLIALLYGGRSTIELLDAILSDKPSEPAALVRETFDRLAKGEDLDRRWRQTVHDGRLDGSASTPVTVPQPAAGKLSTTVKGAASGEAALEIVFCRDASVFDGRFANNGWLQEMPDPITRLTWDNAAVISPATADALQVEDGTLVKLKYQGREVEIPAYVLPGQADGSVAVALGYGRTAAGGVGGSEADRIEPAGVDVYRLRTGEAMEFDAGATIEPTFRKSPLATTQDHFAIDTLGMKARGKRVGTLIREATLEHYREHPDFARHKVHHPPLKSLWEEPPFAEADHRWAMTIDLSKCIGCGACVVACQAENNVPIVGKQRVLQGREMHWLRVDRYFQGAVDNPRVALQPVPCQQCELAPCEQVCPVAATVHSIEGLNDQVYNRCVGTRYCANNCPYKVRRFNYFNYHKALKDPDNEVAKMGYNPEVTVRSRGVMEKCTYCVQRIQAAKIAAKNDRRAIEDGEIRTACQQVCPTGAIVFGDLGPPDQMPADWSTVRRAAQSPRNYAMLAELNVKPRTTYLARIRNPHPELENQG